MARIFQFPKSARTRPQQPPRPAVPPPTGFWQDLFNNKLFLILYGTVWVILFLSWPLLRWIITADLLLQILKVLFLWNAPGVHAGLTCLLHFAVVGAMAYVFIYVPATVLK